MADPHDAILEALRQYEVKELSRSEFIGQLVGLCEGRYRDALDAAARVCDDYAGMMGASSDRLKDRGKPSTVAESKEDAAMTLADRIRALAPGATDRTASRTSGC